MKKIVATFQRYKYLLVISLCSAFMVVLLQTLANTFFTPDSQNLQNIYLEEATGEIIPNTEESTTSQLKSTLQAHELKEFLANGQYEDKSASQVIKRIDLQLEKLLFAFDEPTSPQTLQNGVDVMMNLGNDVDAETSLCTSADQSKQSCTLYLVDKSGHSIPIIARLRSVKDGQSVINMRIGDTTEGYSGTFSGESMKIDIRAM